MIPQEDPTPCRPARPITSRPAVVPPGFTSRSAPREDRRDDRAGFRPGQPGSRHADRDRRRPRGAAGLVTATLSLLLRETVLPAHRRIDALPFFSALRERTLTVERYVDQLRAMAIVAATLERAVATSGDPAVQAVRAAASPRAALLLQDLAHFDRRGPMPDDPKPAAAALGLAGEIILAAAERPLRLVGHLYLAQEIVIGTGAHLEAALAFAGVDGAGTAWYRSGGNEAEPGFTRFCGVLDALSVEEQGRLDAAGGAASAAAGLERIHAELDPGHLPARRLLATTLNVEAGDHEVPRGAAETAAALRAGERCLDEFPYVRDRWGERGVRYTRSDAAWIASLGDLSPEAVSLQVQWLAGILARRGMPSLLLERQLYLLEEELPAGPPSAVRTLVGMAARDLSERRQRALPGDVAGRIEDAFVSSAGSGSDPERRQAARLLLSAVADEGAGFSGAIEALTAWYRSDQFPAAWNDSVDVLVRTALAVFANRGER